VEPKRANLVMQLLFPPPPPFWRLTFTAARGAVEHTKREHIFSPWFPTCRYSPAATHSSPSLVVRNSWNRKKHHAKKTQKTSWKRPLEVIIVFYYALWLTTSGAGAGAGTTGAAGVTFCTVLCIRLSGKSVRIFTRTNRVNYSGWQRIFRNCSWLVELFWLVVAYFPHDSWLVGFAKILYVWKIKCFHSFGENCSDFQLLLMGCECGQKLWPRLAEENWSLYSR
jgi:hypothetical protein